MAAESRTPADRLGQAGPGFSDNAFQASDLPTCSPYLQNHSFTPYTQNWLLSPLNLMQNRELSSVPRGDLDGWDGR